MDTTAAPQSTDAAPTNTPTGATVTLQQAVDVLDQAYPPHLAESWDNVGLTCGDPTATVRTVMVALEANDHTVDAALAADADLLVVHHPLLFKGVTSVATTNSKGRLLHRLIQGDCALYAAHTNADSARGGVNDVLAQLLGVVDTIPLEPTTPRPIDQWGVMVPAESLDQVKEAIFGAGAGSIGEYSDCSFEWSGTGQFTPSDNANPTIGTQGRPERVDEIRLHFIAPTGRRDAIAAALSQAHPYEEPAFDIVQAVAELPAPTEQTGIGRVGRLADPCSLSEFTQRVANALPETVWGVRAAGDPERRIERVAMCSGAGDSLLGAVGTHNVDCYVTSDLRHHPVDEHLRDGGAAVIDTAHWASESPWCESAAALITAKLGVSAGVIAMRTDPWTVSAHKQPQ